MGINKFFKTVGKSTTNVVNTATNTVTTNVVDPAVNTVTPVVDTTVTVVNVAVPIINETTGTQVITTAVDIVQSGNYNIGNIIGLINEDNVLYINLLHFPGGGSLICYWVGLPQPVTLVRTSDNSVVSIYDSSVSITVKSSDVAPDLPHPFDFGSKVEITAACLFLDLTTISVGRYRLEFKNGLFKSDPFTVISPTSSAFKYKTENGSINVNWHSGNNTIKLIPAPLSLPLPIEMLTQKSNAIKTVISSPEATMDLTGVPAGVYYLEFSDFSNVLTAFMLPEPVTNITIPRIISTNNTLTWEGGSKISLVPSFLSSFIPFPADTEIYITPTNEETITIDGNYNSRIIPNTNSAPLLGEFIFQVGINPVNKIGPFYFIQKITSSITNNVLTVTWIGGLENIVLKSSDRVDTISQTNVGTLTPYGLQTTFDLTNFTQNNLTLLFGVEEFPITATYNLNISSRIISDSPDSTNTVTWSGDTTGTATVIGTDITTDNNGNINSQLSTVTGECILQVGTDGVKTSPFYFIRNIKYKKLPKQIKVTWSGGKETIKLMNTATNVFQSAVGTLSTTETESATTNETTTIDLTNISAGTYSFNFGGLGNNVSETFKIISPIIS